MTPLSILGGDGFCFSIGIEERLPNGVVGACTSAASDTGSCVVVWGSGFGIVEDFLCLGLDLGMVMDVFLEFRSTSALIHSL